MASVAEIMGADELEDYLEMCDPTIREQIRKSNAVLRQAAHVRRAIC